MSSPEPIPSLLPVTPSIPSWVMVIVASAVPHVNVNRTLRASREALVSIVKERFSSPFPDVFEGLHHDSVPFSVHAPLLVMVVCTVLSSDGTVKFAGLAVMLYDGVGSGVGSVPGVSRSPEGPPQARTIKSRNNIDSILFISGRV